MTLTLALSLSLSLSLSLRLSLSLDPNQVRGKRGKPRQLSGPELYLHDAPLETLTLALSPSP